MDARLAHGCYGYTCHADSAGFRRDIPAHPRDWLWKCLTWVQRIRLSVILQSATIHAKERYDVSNAGQSNTNASLHNVHCCIRNVRRSVAHDCRCNNFGVILGCFGTWKHLLRSHGEKIKRISMKHTYIISFIAALLGFFCGIPAAASDAEYEEIDVKEVVLGHMSDAHEWHITTWNDVHVTIPLPVIVRSETSGWHVFSSARFHDNADGIYESFYENSEDGKVYEKTPAGDVRPLDISITKNVLQLWIVAALMLGIFLGCSRWYKKKKPSDNAPKGFVGMMEGFLARLEDELMDFRAIEYKGIQKTEEELINLFYFKFQNAPLLSRMDAIRDYCVDEYETLLGRDLSEEELLIVQEKFDKMYVTKDIYKIYGWLLEECGYPSLPDVEYEKRKLEYEDVFPVLYLKYRLTGKAVHNHIKHLVIDEMQDYSYLQYVILNQIFKCRMTILGDKAQTLDEQMRDVLQFLPGVFDQKIRKIVMNKSYRNTMEIARYAEKLTGVKDVELLKRHGKEVVEEQFQTEDAVLDEILSKAKLGEDEYETAAIITMTEAEASTLYQILKARGEEVHYIDRNSSVFKKGLTVTTFYLAKGLEFDQVFGVFQDAGNPMLNQAKYICATRALHELYMYQITE